MNLNAALHYIAFTHYIEVYLDADVSENRLSFYRRESTNNSRELINPKSWTRNVSVCSLMFTCIVWLLSFPLFSVQVLKLFEQFDAPDYVIRVAHLALDFASPDDPNIVSG